MSGKNSETDTLIMKVLSHISVTKLISKKGLCHSLYININILFEIKEVRHLLRSDQKF